MRLIFTSRKFGIGLKQNVQYVAKNIGKYLRSNLKREIENIPAQLKW
jgi:hypothetical protein